MLISLLLLSAPVLLVIADALLPSALLSASLYPYSFSLKSLPSHLTNYDFRSSLVDIPLISLLRSAIIFCVYSFCDGPRLSRGPYLGITTFCSVISLVFVSFKAWFVFGSGLLDVGRGMEVALFMCSLLLAVAHVAVAYRTSCRERRKLLVYKIDIEAAPKDSSKGMGEVKHHHSSSELVSIELVSPRSSGFRFLGWIWRFRRWCKAN
ncbi:hypothetical protein SDJN03_06164, partial [Cucurbita argyrosperma subsp. sororia]